MKRIILLSLWGLVILSGLSSCFDDPQKRPTTSMDTGREFIRATLDGNFRAAETLLLPDSQNLQLFRSYKESYQKYPVEKKQAYKNASYNINTLKDVNDSVSIINYSNSHMNEPMNIKIVKQANIWSVDFRYTVADSLDQ